MQSRCNMAALDNLDRVARNAMRKAFNNAAKSSFAAASESMREVYNISDRNIRKYSRIDPARGKTLLAIIRLLTTKIPVYAFGARKTKPGVTVRIKKKEGRKLLAGVFISKMPSGKISVFARWDPKHGDPQKWRHRFPKGRSSGRKHGLKIKLLTTLNASKMFELHGVDTMYFKFDDEFRKIFENQLQVSLQREAAK